MKYFRSLKNAYFCFFYFFMFASFASQNLTVDISPVPCFEGEMCNLVLSSPHAVPSVIEFPEIAGIKWYPNSVSSQRSTQIINGKVSNSFISRYNLMVQHAGSYKIPPIKIQLGKIKTVTDPFEFTVLKRKYNVQSFSNNNTTKQEQANIEDLLFIKTAIISERNEFYLGEEIPLEIRVYSLNGLSIEPTWPVVEIENAIFKDFKSINNVNPKFEPYRTETQSVGNKNFNVYIFKTAFRPLNSGEINGKVKEQCVVKIPRQQGKRQSPRDLFWDPFDDFDFFSPFSRNYDTYNYEMSAEIGPVKVKPLPNTPSGKEFLGLVGKWNISTELSSEKLKAGEPLTLKLKIKGDGTLETLKAPELNISGFRSYPPETDKGIILPGGKISTEIRYVLIPLEEGSASLNFNFCFFSTETEKYEEIIFDKVFNVAKGDSNAKYVVTESSALPFVDTITNKSKKKTKTSEILGLKTNKGDQVMLPVWKNRLLLSSVLFSIGILFPVLSSIINFWNLKISSDPVLKRKIDARNRHGKVLSSIRKANDEEIYSVVRETVVPYLNDSLGLPHGTSISELSKHLENKKLVECLLEGEASSYMPGAMSNSDLKQRLLNSIKKCVFFVFLAAISMNVFGEAENEKISPSPILALEDKSVDPITSYYDGNFRRAAEIYARELDSRKLNPVTLYNLGDCLYQMGDLSLALVSFERASKLAPRDSDIKENLNLVRRKLSLPESGKIEHPLELLESLRDSLRPDEWLLLFSLFVLIAGIFIGLRKKFSQEAFISSTLVAVSAAILCLIIVIIQNSTSYSYDNAFVTERNATVHLLPSDKSDVASFKFDVGENVKTLEERNGWIRVRSENSEGWLKSDNIRKLWP